MADLPLAENLILIVRIKTDIKTEKTPLELAGLSIKGLDWARFALKGSNS